MHETRTAGSLPVLLVAATLAVATGCATVPTAPPLSTEDIVQLAREDVSPELLRLATRSTGLAFPLDAESIVELRRGGVSDDQVQALLAGSEDRSEDRRRAREAIDLTQLLSPMTSILGMLL